MSYNKELKEGIREVIESLRQSKDFSQLKTMSDIYTTVPLFASVIMLRDHKVNQITPTTTFVDRLGQTHSLSRNYSINEFIQNYLALRISKQAKGRSDLVDVTKAFFHSVLVGEKGKEAVTVGNESPARVDPL